MEIEMGSSIPGWMFDPSLLATPFFSPSAVGSVSSGGVPRSESYEGFPIDWTGKPDNGGVAATQRERVSQPVKFRGFHDVDLNCPLVSDAEIPEDKSVEHIRHCSVLGVQSSSVCREEDITHCMVQRAPRASGCRYVG
ncbi:unnamed protein product [Urochloa humidicola]